MGLERSFFDFVSDNKNDSIFSIFANKNSRDANYYILKQCFEIIKNQTNAQINKEELINQITSFVKKNNLFNDKNKDDYYESTDEEKIRNANDFTRIKIKRFIECGWLIEDQSRDEVFTKYISLNEYTRPIFESMIQIANSDKTPPEYSNNLLIINDSLDRLLDSNNENNNLYVYYYSIVEHCDKLRSQLSSSSSRIRRYINKMGSYDELNKLIEDFVNGYNVKIARPFYNFRIKDKPAIMQGIILKKFNELLNNDNLISKITENSLDRQGFILNSDEFLKAFNSERNLILKNLTKTLTYLKNLEMVIDSIDYKDNNYIIAAKTKIEYKTSDYHDLRDEINETIDLLRKSNVHEFEIDDHLTYLRNIDYLSLRKPAKISTKLDDVIVSVNDLSLEDKEQLKYELIKEFKNDFNRINDKLVLIKTNEIDAKTLIKSYSFDEYEIFMIYLHSTDLNFAYSIEVTTEVLKMDNFSFYNFILRRK